MSVSSCPSTSGGKSFGFARCRTLDPLTRHVAEHATTILAWVFATMQRRRRSATITPPPSTHSGANVICVVVGSRFKRIPRRVLCRPHNDHRLTLAQNTRYVVVSGARQKDEEWDPEENGGFAVHGTPQSSTVSCTPLRIRHPETDPNKGPVDPLAALEKSTDAQNHMDNVQVPRIEAVQNLADHYGSDPYSHSLRVRKRFREQKRLDKAREEADEALKSNYGLPEELALSKEDDESRSKAKEEWKQARQAFEERESSKRRKLGAEAVSVMPRIPSSHISGGSGQSSRHAGGSGTNPSTTSDPVSSLRAKILGNTARQGSFGRLKPPDAKPARGLVKRVI